MLFLCAFGEQPLAPCQPAAPVWCSVDGIAAALAQWWEFLPKSCFNSVTYATYRASHQLLCRVRGPLPPIHAFPHPQESAARLHVLLLAMHRSAARRNADARR